MDGPSTLSVPLGVAPLFPVERLLIKGHTRLGDTSGLEACYLRRGCQLPKATAGSRKVLILESQASSHKSGGQSYDVVLASRLASRLVNFGSKSRSDLHGLSLPRNPGGYYSFRKMLIWGPVPRLMHWQILQDSRPRRSVLYTTIHEPNSIIGFTLLKNLDAPFAITLVV